MNNTPADSLISNTPGYLESLDTTLRPPTGHPTPGTAFDLRQLLELWSTPPHGDEAAAHAMRSMYADPVVINGISTTVADLVTRARSLADALENVSRDVIDVFRSENKVAVAFRMRGIHAGPLVTSAGVLAPTGKGLTLRVIDILTLKDGLITEVVMVADELGALNNIGAVALVPNRG